MNVHFPGNKRWSHDAGFVAFVETPGELGRAVPTFEHRGRITSKMHIGKCLLIRTGVDGKQPVFDRVAGVTEVASYAVWCLKPINVMHCKEIDIGNYMRSTD